MYFTNRKQAGELLAAQLVDYKFRDNAVLALSRGGVTVGLEIADMLNCPMQLLLTSRISAPGDPSLVLGAMTSDGTFSYNDLIPASMMEEYMDEFRGYVEDKKLHKLFDLTILGPGGEVDVELLRNRNIIIVSDGVSSGLSFLATLQFLKPIATQKLVGAIPVGPIQAIDMMRLRLDELHYLYIPDNFFTIDHYYMDNAMPDMKDVVKQIDATAARW
jgi:putative phosphoribosyl transferase